MIPRGFPRGLAAISPGPPLGPKTCQKSNRQPIASSRGVKTGQRGPKTTPSGLKGPSWSRLGGPKKPKSLKNQWFLYGFRILAVSVIRASKTAQRSLRDAQEDPIRAHQGPKRGPRGAEDGSKSGPQRAPKTHSELTWLGYPSGTPPGPLRGPILEPNWDPKRAPD